MTTHNTYTDTKKQLLQINELLSSLVSSVQNKPVFAETRFNDWQKTCATISRQISDEVVRIAIVGPIKSGKSTLINSLFDGDYLKRGAGVVTSIVTRIRSGDELQAILYFKSRDEVNREIASALDLFSSWEPESGQGPFDIFREQDRNSLKSALEEMSGDMHITDGTRNSKSILLSLYLKGFDRIREIISSDSLTTEFSSNNFAQHKDFSGNDSLAVYLKDIELMITSGSIDKSIEIADCQGSDSLNPLHSVMIQNYLLKTHLIVYVVSSRTGLRQADLRFLSLIKKIGIITNILFVVNCDFSEHESLEDLRAVIDKIRDEISLIRPDPDIYSFSALFKLFSSLSGNLSKKDSLRLAQWKTEKQMVDFSSRETERFTSTLNGKLTQERPGLLSENHLQRFGVMASGIERWAWMSREVLQKDIGGDEEIRKKIERYQNRIDQIKSLIQNTLSGATEKLGKELKAEVDRFFSSSTESMFGQTLTYARQYTVPMTHYRNRLLSHGFSGTLHRVFQDFQQALSAFIEESIQPEIIRFTGTMEDLIKARLESVTNPFQAMISEAVSELKAAVGKSVPESLKSSLNAPPVLNIEEVKENENIRFPVSASALQYSTKIKSEAYARLGFYSTIKFIRKIMKKPESDEQAAQLSALDSGLKRIKAETEEYLTFHFENYRENLKFLYLLKLLHAGSEHLQSLLMERFQFYGADMNTIEKLVVKEEHEREELVRSLDKFAEDARHIQEMIASERERVKLSDSSEL
jgi:GTPase SAR1 family protein